MWPSFTAAFLFDAVADREKRYYCQFGVESSWSAVSPAAIKAALASILRGSFGLKITGSPLGLPAEFLVAPDGRIKAAHTESMRTTNGRSKQF